MKEERFDLQQFLRRFGIVIYTGDPEGDRLLIEDEIRELYQFGLIDKEEMMQALAALNARKK
ncbi:YqgQ family protein [Brevibacillus marinus]|uniref:YqgQ family protein n=1 Tax=Brevibacillus marinus TaxID=2496837 RepID=UPI000F827EF5|nr:YqgQ family protein [Brevibacillus marinus]